MTRRTDMTKTNTLLSEGAKTATRLAEGAKTATVLSGGAKVGLGLLGVVQAVFAFLAFWDLSWRNEKEIRGPKLAWIPAILVNWVGPAAYFLVGIRHRR
jgi:hypothetical protein